MRLICIIFVVQFTTGCHGNFIGKSKTSWVDASTSCRINSSKLACITEDTGRKLIQNSVKSAWVDTVITFSDWVRFIGCYNVPKIEGVTLLNEMKIGTCQLICRNQTYFGLKGIECICFVQPKNESKTSCKETDAIHIYEKVNTTHHDNHLILDMQSNSTALYCRKRDISSGFMILGNTSCKCNENKLIVICSYGKKEDTVCFNFKDFKKDVVIDRTFDIVCKLYNIIQKAMTLNIMSVDSSGDEFRYLGYSSYTTPYKVFKQSQVEYSSTFLASSADDRTSPVVRCSKVNIIDSNEKYRIRFSLTSRCNDKREHNNFICENKDSIRQPPCNIQNFNISTTQIEAIKTEVVVGITVALVCVIVVIAIVVCICIRNRRKGSLDYSEKNEGVSPYACTELTYMHSDGNIPHEEFTDGIGNNRYTTNGCGSLTQADIQNHYTIIEPETLKSDKRLNVKKIAGSKAFMPDEKLQQKGRSVDPIQQYSEPLPLQSVTHREVKGKDYDDPKDGVYDHLHETGKRKIPSKGRKNQYDHMNQASLKNR